MEWSNFEISGFVPVSQHTLSTPQPARTQTAGQNGQQQMTFANAAL